MIEREILGTVFQIQCTHSALLDYTDAFLDAYRPNCQSTAACPLRFLSLKLIPDQPRAVTSADGQSVAVHRTKHPYWTFSGVLLETSPRVMVWPTKGLEIRLDLPHIEIRASSRLSTAAAGEAVFHAMRGIALALRSSGPMFHAAVVQFGGRGIAFSGDSLAGKTTLFVETVVRLGAAPVSNDRCVIQQQGGGIQAISWPSYSSYCEGTLRAYPELARAALDYETGDCAYRTQRWPAQLENSFRKDRKRIYPMRWFVQATGVFYEHATELAAIALSRLTTREGPISWRELDPASSEVAARLHEQVFVGDDPAFLPWHGIHRDEAADAAELERFFGELSGTGVRVFELDVPVARIADVRHFIEEACRAPGAHGDVPAPGQVSACLTQLST